MAVLAGGPLLVGVLGCLVGGLLTDWHVRRTGDRKWGRSLYGVIGFAGAGGCYLIAILGARSGNMWMFAAGVAMSGFFNDLAMGPSWAVCQDIGRRYAAIVSGFMNMVGNLGGVTTLIVTAAIMQSQIGTKQAELRAALPEGTEPDAAALAAATRAGEIEGYIINLSLYAIAYFIGVFFWLMIDARKPIVPEGAQPTEPNSDEQTW
jgi:MFS family permease